MGLVEEEEDDLSSRNGVADSQSAASCFWIRIEDIFSPFDAIQGNLKDMFNRETTGYLICCSLPSTGWMRQKVNQTGQAKV